MTTTYFKYAIKKSKYEPMHQFVAKLKCVRCEGNLSTKDSTTGRYRKCGRPVCVGTPYCSLHLHKYAPLKKTEGFENKSHSPRLYAWLTILESWKKKSSANKLSQLQSKGVIFPKGVNICMFDGEPVTKSQMIKRYKTKNGRINRAPHAFAFPNDHNNRPDIYMDAALVRGIGAIARQVPPSDANAILYPKYDPNAKVCNFILVARKDIRHGEEITIPSNQVHFNKQQKGITYITKTQKRSLSKTPTSHEPIKPDRQLEPTWNVSKLKKKWGKDVGSLWLLNYDGLIQEYTEEIKQLRKTTGSKRPLVKPPVIKHVTVYKPMDPRNKVKPPVIKKATVYKPRDPRKKVKPPVIKKATVYKPMKMKKRKPQQSFFHKSVYKPLQNMLTQFISRFWRTKAKPTVSIQPNVMTSESISAIKDIQDITEKLIKLQTQILVDKSVIADEPAGFLSNEILYYIQLFKKAGHNRTALKSVIQKIKSRQQKRPTPKKKTKYHKLLAKLENKIIQYLLSNESVEKLADMLQKANFKGMGKSESLEKLANMLKKANFKGMGKSDSLRNLADMLQKADFKGMGKSESVEKVATILNKADRRGKRVVLDRYKTMAAARRIRDRKKLEKSPEKKKDRRGTRVVLDRYKTMAAARRIREKKTNQTSSDKTASIFASKTPSGSRTPSILGSKTPSIFGSKTPSTLGSRTPSKFESKTPTKEKPKKKKAVQFVPRQVRMRKKKASPIVSESLDELAEMLEKADFKGMGKSPQKVAEIMKKAESPEKKKGKSGKKLKKKKRRDKTKKSKKKRRKKSKVKKKDKRGERIVLDRYKTMAAAHRIREKKKNFVKPPVEKQLTVLTTSSSLRRKKASDERKKTQILARKKKPRKVGLKVGPDWNAMRDAKTAHERHAIAYKEFGFLRGKEYEKMAEEYWLRFPTLPKNYSKEKYSSDFKLPPEIGWNRGPPKTDLFPDQDQIPAWYLHMYGSELPWSPEKKAKPKPKPKTKEPDWDAMADAETTNERYAIAFREFGFLRGKQYEKMARKYWQKFPTPLSTMGDPILQPEIRWQNGPPRKDIWPDPETGRIPAWYNTLYGDSLPSWKKPNKKIDWNYIKKQKTAENRVIAAFHQFGALEGARFRKAALEYHKRFSTPKNFRFTDSKQKPPKGWEKGVPRPSVDSRDIAIDWAKISRDRKKKNTVNWKKVEKTAPGTARHKVFYGELAALKSHLRDKALRNYHMRFKLPKNYKTDSADPPPPGWERGPPKPTKDSKGNRIDWSYERRRKKAYAKLMKNWPKLTHAQAERRMNEFNKKWR